MKFIDSVKIHVRSGSGGDGCTSFRREKFVPNGGPDGGDGGNGGEIIFVGDNRKNTLLDLSYKQHQYAENGIRGGGSEKHGRNGKTLFIHVPLGTIVKDLETGEIFLEILRIKKYLLFPGGRGGRGNARFKSSRKKAPKFHEKGESGRECWLKLELKVLADVGLVGFPNSGKSTFISIVSKAKPKIANYPFTTLIPQLGVVETKNFNSFVIADIPGIIEGAHLGKGLGDRFLKHIERTKCLIIMIDISGFSENPPIEEYKTIINELNLYSNKLTKKPRLIALTKIDTVKDFEDLDKLQLILESKKEHVFRISSLNRQGLPKLINFLENLLEKQRTTEKSSSEKNKNIKIPNSIWND